MSFALKDVYQSVTDQIVTALEAGTPPWVCPWQAGSGDLAPANLYSGRPYRGVNVLLLNLRAMSSGYSANRWMAEIGSAFLTNYAGLSGHVHHASYIDSWLQALRDDKRLIFTAASLAQKAADYLLPAPVASEDPMVSKSLQVAA